MRRSLSFAVAAFAVAAPLAAASAINGCSSGEQFESVCLWVADPDNCYRSFREDSVNNGETCKPLGAPTPVDVATGSNGTQNGAFLGRDKLDVCFVGAGGQVVFDPPLDLSMFPPPLLAPPTTYKVTFKRPNGTTCGNATYSSPHGFTFTIDAPPDGGSSTINDAGGADAGDAGPSLPYGTYSQVIEAGRDAFDATCPSGETHHFNLVEIEGSSTTEDGGSRSTCPRVSDLVPRAQFAVNPGGIGMPGAVSLTIYWPPIDPNVKYPDGADASLAASGPSIAAEAVTYFNCGIPPKDRLCEDGAKNGAETDVDCGGAEAHPGCPARCLDGNLCNVDCDCRGDMQCTVVGGVRTCTVPTDSNGNPVEPPSRDCSPFIICEDKNQNGLETGIDCGGGECPRCTDGNPCLIGTDCDSNYCYQGTCATPLCSDGNKNVGETDTDCGGATPCDRCANGKTCAQNSDCQSNSCVGGTCKAKSCSKDGQKNDTETDTDCGGPNTTCDRCENLQECLVHADCKSKACMPFNGKLVCLFASCSDTVKNGEESDVDCGGPTDADGGIVCERCADAQLCNADSDCEHGVCRLTPPGVQRCFPAKCAPDTACGTADCQLCANEKPCTDNKNCLSNTCLNGLCKAPDCDDKNQNGTETDVDCGGSQCKPCEPQKKCLVDSDCGGTVKKCVGNICQ